MAGFLFLQRDQYIWVNMHWPVIHHDIDPLGLRVGRTQILEKLYQRGKRDLAGPPRDHPASPVLEGRDHPCQGIATVAPACARLLVAAVLDCIGLCQGGLLLNRDLIKVDQHHLSGSLPRQHAKGLHIRQFGVIVQVGTMDVAARALPGDMQSFEQLMHATVSAQPQPGTGGAQAPQAPASAYLAIRAGGAIDGLAQFLGGCLSGRVARGKKPAYVRGLVASVNRQCLDQ